MIWIELLKKDDLARVIIQRSAFNIMFAIKSVELVLILNEHFNLQVWYVFGADMIWTV